VTAHPLTEKGWRRSGPVGPKAAKPARLLSALLCSGWLLALPSALLCSGWLLALPLAARAETPVQPPVTTAMPAPAAAAQEQKPRSGWAALPVGSYTPETELGLGLFAAHFFRLGDAGAETRPSSISAVGLYTMRSQIIVELIPELYWNDMRWHVRTRLDYRRYPNSMWAVGNRAPDSSKESYTEDRWRWQATVDHAIAGPLRVEMKLELVSMHLTDERAGGLLATSAVHGAQGGRTVGVGPGLLWDSRDHLLQPRRGELYEVALMGYGAPLGSEYTVGELLTDLRKYISLADGHVLALQLYSQLQVGTAPFYDLPQLGGQNLLRGYFEGRFRDKALLALQAEYRLPLFWRFSGVVHAAMGQVADKLLALWSQQPKWSAGPGLRISLNTDERLNLRADLGLCEEGFGLYVGIGEAY